ncbi:MAG: MarR family winged helix-turn-helix transcriptional regulator [Desulfotignum sp.]|nr:MarR family winged helix-turn-helix transcriptional regulator [Desulfotignum sp.]
MDKTADIKKTIKLQSVFDVIHDIRMALGVTSVQHMEILLQVMMEEGRSQIEIARLVDMTAGQMATTIPRLRDKGVIDDYPVKGRTKAVDLTPKARRVRDNIKG